MVESKPDASADLHCFAVPRNHVAAGAYIEPMYWLTAHGIAAGQRSVGLGGARTSVPLGPLDHPTSEAPMRLPKTPRA